MLYEIALIVTLFIGQTISLAYYRKKDIYHSLVWSGMTNLTAFVNWHVLEGFVK